LARKIPIPPRFASNFRAPNGLQGDAPMTGPTPIWTPSRHAERRRMLVARGEIVAALRAYFAEHDFVEVETPALQVSPGNEIHLQAFATDLTQAGCRGRRYLRTSPEFACKKLLAAGERRIVEFARVFRNGERGPLHHPEFTMLEWYRAQDEYGQAPYDAVIDDCIAVIARAAQTIGSRAFAWRGRAADPCASPESLTVAEAFVRHAGIDVLSTLTSEAPDRDAFAALASKAGVATAPDDTWGDVFSRVMVERIEPHLGLGRPTILNEYPAAMSALARRKPSDPRVAERFEIFVCGIELANGFGEETDADAQRERLEAQMAEKARIYGERYPIDDDFIEALRAMPPASGVALGLDRLVMLSTGATHIEQVFWSPVAEL
jgi:lysyl-tRNA synthetase class 2